eukprot:evm.model.scf_1145EXC.6 EVM.evm.TU.scf_1145EXC.6   scf_1145EXC:29722-31548(-)
MSAAVSGSSYGEVSERTNKTSEGVSISDADFDGLLDGLTEASALPSAEATSENADAMQPGADASDGEGGGPAVDFHTPDADAGDLLDKFGDDGDLLDALRSLSESDSAGSTGGGTEAGGHEGEVARIGDDAAQSGEWDLGDGAGAGVDAGLPQGTPEGGREGKGGRSGRRGSAAARRRLTTAKIQKSESTTDLATKWAADAAGTSGAGPEGDGDRPGSKRARLDPSPSAPRDAPAGMCPPHPGYMYGLCIRCGCQRSDGDGGGGSVPLRYFHRGLELSRAEADRMAQDKLALLDQDRKLNLVLDLDHTLLNTVVVADVSEEQTRLVRKWMDREEAEEGRGQRRTLHHLPKSGIYTKLRPFVFEFLERVRHLYHLYIYTMGDREYCTDMARLLDPSGELFYGRLISRNDSSSNGVKSLDVVLATACASLIVDDTQGVWPEHQSNLLRIERYLFFPSSVSQFGSSSLSLLVTGHDEAPNGGQLSVLLRVLEHIHSLYFDDDSHKSCKDVRVIRGSVRQQILAGVRLVFSGVIPRNHQQPRMHKYWQMAEELGADVAETVGKDVTHLVAVTPGTEKVAQAKAIGCKIVKPNWLDHCSVVWEKVDEALHELL